MTDTIKSLLAEIAALTDLDQLRELRRAVEARAELIRNIQRQKAITDRWTKIERCKPGTILYDCSSGIHVGSRIQRGDSVKVVAVDRKRERIVVMLHRIGGKLQRSTNTYALSPSECAHYELERDKPSAPLTPQQRKMGSDLARVLGGE